MDYNGYFKGDLTFSSYAVCYDELEDSGDRWPRSHTLIPANFEQVWYRFFGRDVLEKRERAVNTLSASDRYESD